MLRQAYNSVKVEGILEENKLKDITYTKDGKDVHAIGGSVIVRVNQDINGKSEELSVPIHYFINQMTKAGAPNKNYGSLKKFMENAVSIAACGNIDKASRVRITGANIRMNEYYPEGSTTLVSEARISSNFITIISAEDCKPTAEFSIEFAIGEMGEEADKEGNATGRDTIKAIVPGYNGTVDIVPFLVSNPNVINVIRTNWQEGDSVKAIGKLNFSFRVEEYKEPVDFGEPLIKQRTVKTNELIITGGAQAPLGEGQQFDADELRTAMAARKARLEEAKNKPKKTAEAPAKKASFMNDSDF